MTTATTEDYVAKRAELLAELVLTRQKGVEVFRFENPRETGMHLLATLPAVGGVQKGSPILPRFGVEVLGTDDPLETEEDATSYARKYWKEQKGRAFFLGPVALLLFSMEGDKGYFGWLMEPRVSKGEGPTLARVYLPTMTKITKASTETIFRDLEAWFEAMVQLVIRDKK